jgi:tartrate/fumarate subfamily iron-sulfur-dependent hydro-lyase alpha chain
MTVLTARQVAEATEKTVAHLACNLRPDYLRALEQAVDRETGERGRAVLGQLLENARIAAEDGVPLCQDTGYVWLRLEVAGDVMVPADVFAGVDAAVAAAYERAGMRASMLADALLDRSNTKTNTPAFCELICYSESQKCHPKVTLHIMLKGGGSDNASNLTMLPPGAGIEGIERVVLNAVTAKAANACPPLVVGVGVGGTFDKVAGLAKQALLREIGSPNGNVRLGDLEAHLLERINATGIGPGGLGGSTTALAVHIQTAPCHIAALPVAVNMGCCAMRSASIDLLAQMQSS